MHIPYLLRHLPLDFLPLEYVRSVCGTTVFKDPHFPASKETIFGEKSESIIQRPY